MKKLFGGKKKDETSGQSAPPPPPPRSGGPSSGYSSSRNLDESGGTYSAEGSSRNIPQQQQQNDNNVEGGGVTELPSDDVLAAKLRDFYLVHDAKKAGDLDKIIAAAKKNGIKWLQDGLQRKYNGASIDFSSDVGTTEYSNGARDAEMEPEVDEPPPPKPPPPPAKALPAPQVVAQAPPPPPPKAVPPPMHNVGGGNNMFIGSQPPPSYATGEAHAVAYPNAATALKSKGLGKYVKQLEERGIINYEDLATLEESPNDPLWMSMPPIPDRKNLRNLVQTVKDYVASASFLGEAPSPASASGVNANLASPRSTSTPFDDHPELVVEESSPAVPIPFAPPPPQRAPVPQFAPPPPPKHFGEEFADDQAEMEDNIAEEEAATAAEARRLEAAQQQEENERQARIQAEEMQRKKREAEEKRRVEEEQQQRKRKEAAPPAPPAKASSAAPPPAPPPPQAAKAVPPPAAAAMKRKQSSESQMVMVPVAQIEEAERVAAELKDKLDDQNSLCEQLVSKAEELAKQLEEAQAEAERENEKLEKITVEFEAAQAKLASLRTKQKAAQPAPPPPVVFAPPPPPAQQQNDSFDEQTPEEQDRQEQEAEEEQDSGMMKAAPPPPAAMTSPTNSKLERSASGNKLTRVESTKSVSSTEGESTRPAVLSGGSHHGGGAAAEIAQEASHAKLRATTTREKTAEPCNNYEVDLKATEFGKCVCGHKKSEHKAGGGTSPAAPFQTGGSGRFGPGRGSITKEHSSFRDNAAATSPSSVMAPEHVSPTKAENPYAAKGMYPALEPCDNFQVDLSASAFGMCQCGHAKQHHKSMTSPNSSSANLKEMPKLRSSRTVGEHELPQVSGRKSGDSNSGTFPKPAGVGMDAPVPPASTTAAPGTKPPPPARRPSVLAASNSSRQLAPSTAATEEKKTAAPAAEEPPAAPQPQAREANGADAGPDHRSRLVDFYTRYNPEKLSEVDTILAKFKGKELVMFKKLKEKYPDAEI